MNGKKQKPEPIRVLEGTLNQAELQLQAYKKTVASYEAQIKRTEGLAKDTMDRIAALKEAIKTIEGKDDTGAKEPEKK